MRHSILSFFLITLLIQLQAQPVKDTVSLGAGYAHQVWYSLDNDEQGTLPKADWDIAFDASLQGYSIAINPAVGTELWLHPGDTSQFATADTSGIHGWNPVVQLRYLLGLWGILQKPSGFLMWVGGSYNPVNHIVTGDRFFIIKLASGQYQKLWIQKLALGTYTFRHASLDNRMDMVHTLAKSPFAGKNFGYFKLQTHSDANPEPPSANWDLLFTQYRTIVPVPTPTPYLVSGVLQNYHVEAAKAYPVNDPAGYSDYGSQHFHREINTIGYDWKNYVGMWQISDSTVYFVRTKNGAIWKMVFTGFGGAADGNFIFTKEKLIAASIDKKVSTTFMHPLSQSCPARGLCALSST